MPRPIDHRSAAVDLVQNRKGVDRMRRRPLTGVWHRPLEDDDPDQATIESLWPAESPIDFPPPILTADGWGQPATSRFQYRWHADGAFETKGFLVAGTSGTEVIHFPLSFMAGLDATVAAVIDLVSGATFTFGRAEIDTETGIMIVTYPAT